MVLRLMAHKRPESSEFVHRQKTLLFQLTFSTTLNPLNGPHTKRHPVKEGKAAG